MVIFSLALIVFIIGLELGRRHNSSFDALSVFSFYYLLYHPIPSSLILLFPEFYQSTMGTHLVFVPEVNALTLIFQWVYYCAFAFVYLRARTLPLVLMPFLKPEVKFMAPVVTAVLIINSLAYYLWSLDYGGPMEALTIANDLRDGFAQVETRFSFLKRFWDTTPFVLPFFIYVLVNLKQLTSQMKLMVLLTLPIWISVVLISFLGHAGRAEIINFIIILIGVALWKPGSYVFAKIRPYKILLTGITFVLSVFVLIFANSVFSSLRALSQGPSAFFQEISLQQNETFAQLSQSNTFFAVASNFLHHTYSIDAAVHGTNGGSLQSISYGIEIPNAFIDLAPSVLVRRGPSLSTEHRNNLVLNPNRYASSGPSAGGSIPPGAIASTIYMFGYFGPLLVPVICALLIKRFERFILLAFNGIGSINLFYVAGLFIITPLVLGFQPQAFVLGSILDVFIYAFLIFLIAFRNTKPIRSRLIKGK